MNNNVQVKVDVVDGGSTDRLNSKAIKLKNTYEGVQAAARVPLATQAARQGVDVTAKKSAAAPSGAASDTNLSRGVAGVTGASGRDFATQAQGLGGLVHVYATFAANLFAVSAAWTALSHAMDTSNLVKGLDQIGAASGKNLGSLAKQMVAVSDGALSLKESLTSVALASSGGMSNLNILRMAEVAKKASIALGRDLPDSMERLTKGIVKSQPELLDELGIMTRMIPAQREYARETGKTVSSLSTFEKQLAFTNAVLAEGERKFNDIELAANSYSKVLASMKNVLFGALENINKVIGPIMTFLSSNPTALLVSMGAIAAILLKQAIPALGMFKENMTQAAEQAKQLALFKVSEAQKGYKSAAVLETNAAVELAKSQFQIVKDNAKAMAKEKVGAVVRSENEIKKLAKSARGGAVTKEILGRDIHTEADAIAMDRLALDNQQKLNKAIEDGNLKRTAMLDKTVQAQKTYASSIRDNIKFTEEETRVRAEGAIALAAEETKIKESENARARAMLEKRSWMNTDRQAQILADRAMIASVSQGITAQAAQTASVKGFSTAMREAWGSIKAAQKESFKEMDLGKKVIDDTGKSVSVMESVYTPALGKIRSGWVLTRSAISAATGAVSTFMSFAGIWLQLIGLAVGAFTILASYMTTSAKESTSFAESINSLDGSLENIDRTLESIEKRKDFFSIQTTQAKATAMADLTQSFSALYTKFMKLEEAQSGWDKFWDKWFFDLIGKGNADKLSIGLSNTIINAFKLMEEGPLKEEAKRSMENIIGSSIDFNGKSGALNDKIKDLDGATISNMAKRVAKDLDATSIKLNIAASKLTDFKDALKKIAEQQSETSNTLIPTDAFSKTGIVLTDGAAKLGRALKDPIDGLKALIALSKNTQTMSFIDPKMAVELGVMSDKMTRLGDAVVRARANVAQANKDVSNLVSEQESLNVKGSLGKDTNRPKPLSAYTEGTANYALEHTILLETDKTKAENRKKDAESQLASATLAAAVVTNKWNILEKEMFKVGLAYLEKGLTRAMTEASIIAAKGYLDVIKGFGGYTAAMEGDLAKEAITAQMADLDATYDNSKKLMSLTLELERNTLTIQKEAAERRLDVAERNGVTDTSAIQTIIKGIADSLSATESAIKDTKLGEKGLLAKRRSMGSSDLSRAEIEGLDKLSPLINQIYGKMEKMAKLSAELSNAEVKKQMDIIKEDATKAQKIIKDSNAQLTVDNSQLTILQAMSDEYNSILQTEKERISIDQLNNQYKEKELSLSTFEAEANKTIEMLKDKAKEGSREAQMVALAKDGLARVEIDRKTLLLQKEKELATLMTSNLKSRMDGEISLFSIQSAHEEKLRGYALEITSAKLTNSEANLSYLKEIGSITEAQYITESNKIKLQQQEVIYSNEVLKIKDAQYLAEKKITDEIFIAQQLKNSISTSGARPDRQDAQTSLVDATLTTKRDQLSRITAEYTAQRAAVDAKNDSIIYGIKLTEDWKKLIADQTEQMAKMVSVTESLATVFGDVGTSIGKVGEAILKMANDDTTYLEQKLALEKELEVARKANAEDDSGAHAKAEEDATKKFKEGIAKLDKKHINDQLGGYASLMGATKKMFAEHTGAYKILGAAEKAFAAMKAFNQLKELVGDLKNFAIRIGLIESEAVVESAQTTFMMSEHAAAAGEDIALTTTTEAVKNTAKAPGVLASFMSWLGPWGMAAGIAALAAIGLSGSGGSSVDMTGKTAKDLQETQGTGQSWVTGPDGTTTKQANGGGVFGDVTAKSESIQKSLDLIAATTVEGMSYFNEMVDLLTKIKDGITGVSESLYQIPGISTGMSPFGTTNSTSGSNFLGGLFGSSSSTEIVNSGIKFHGAFTDFVNGITGSVNQFETVLQTNSSSFLWMSNTSSHLIENIKDLKPEVLKTITDVFNNAAQLFVTLGDKLGYSESDIMSKLAKIPVSALASLKDLSGPELDAAMQSVFSKIFDDTAMALFGKLDKFKKFGEGFLETVIRVIDTNDKIKLAFASLGIAFKAPTDIVIHASAAILDAQRQAQSNYDAILAGYNEDTTNPVKLQRLRDAESALQAANSAAADSMTTYSFDITEALAKAAGGLDKFLSSVQYFADHFLSEAERLGNRGKAANATFLSLATPKVPTTENGTLIHTNANGVGGPATGIAAPPRVSNSGGGALSQSNVNLQKTSTEKLTDSIDNLKASIDNLSSNVIDNTNGVASPTATAAPAPAPSALDSNSTHNAGAALLTSTVGGNTADYAFTHTRSQYTEMMQGLAAAAASGTEGAAELYAQLLKLAPGFDEVWTKVEEFNKAIKDQAVTLLQATGQTYAAEQLARQNRYEDLRQQDATNVALGNASAGSLEAGQRAIDAATDKAKSENLQVQLLQAEGRSYEALLATRAKNLLSLSAEDQVIQRAIDAAEDRAKTEDLEVRLLRAQHREGEALNRTRAKELKALSATDQAIMRQIYAQEDLNAAEDKLAQAKRDQTAAQKALDDANASAAADAAKAIEDAAKALRDALAAAGNTIFSFIKEIMNAVNTLSDTSLKRLKVSYENDLEKARLGDITASENIATSGKAYLDAQVSTAATRVDADRARLLMINQLKALPAVKTYEESLLEAVRNVNTSVGGTTTAVEDLKNVKIRADLTVEALSTISMLLKVTRDTPGLTPELIDLALLTGSELSKTVTIAVAQGSIDPYISGLALTLTDSIAKTATIAVRLGTKDPYIASLALDTTANLAKIVGVAVTMDTSTPANLGLRDLVMSTAGGINKTVRLLLDDTSLSNDQKELTYSTLGDISRNIALHIIDFNTEDATIILSAVSGVSKTVDLAIGDSDPVALAIATAQGGTINRVMTASLGRDLTPAEETMLNGIEIYTKNILLNIGVDTSGLTQFQQVLQTYFGTTDLSKINDPLSNFSVNGAITSSYTARQAALDNYINEKLVWEGNTQAMNFANLWSIRAAAISLGFSEHAVVDALRVGTNAGFANLSYDQMREWGTLAGYEEYAKGGIFSNSIVKEPTKFSVMGEAGPEAIMPLRKDAQGRLGVSANMYGNGINNNEELIKEIQALREQVKVLTASSNRNADASVKTRDLMKRVTLDGEAMQVESYDSTTVVIGV